MNVSRTLTVFLLAAGFAFTGFAQQTYIINSLRYSPELEKYAENGNATAQNNLGVVYQKGSGVEADLGKAIYWFTKGAEGGNDKAMVNLGAAYLKGTGVDQNIPEAVRLFEKAALQMNQGAFYNLALLYREGLGVEKNPETAFRYALKAADADEVSERFDEDALFKKEDKDISGSAQFMVSSFYHSGFGTSPDMEKSMQYLRRAAENDHPVAAYIMGNFCENGAGVEKSLFMSERFYRKAADNGFPLAAYLLGSRYATGDVFKKNEENAVKYLTLAVADGANVPPVIKADALLKLANLLDATGSPADAGKAQSYRSQASKLPAPDPAQISQILNDI